MKCKNVHLDKKYNEMNSPTLKRGKTKSAEYSMAS